MARPRRLASEMTWEIPIPTDENGKLGRECPNSECLGYFKLKSGTGIKGDSHPCTYPYCGQKAPHGKFWSKDQLDYAESIAMRDFTDLVVARLKKSEFNVPATGPFGIGFSMKVEAGPPPPIRAYREKSLETELTCLECTLEYAIYGVFGFCPDCGVHNSKQILDVNLELAHKELRLADTLEEVAMRDYLVCDALENVVSAFDGFGRETVRAHAPQSIDPKKVASLSFQNLTGAERNVHELFGVNLSDGVDSGEWTLLVRCFQKRHLLSHRLGVVDERYITATNDTDAVVGRKVTVSALEVEDLIVAVTKLGKHLAASF